MNVLTRPTGGVPISASEPESARPSEPTDPFDELVSPSSPEQASAPERASGAGGETVSRRSLRRRRTLPKRRRTIILTVAAVVVAFGIFAIGWATFQVVQARSSLESAVGSMTQLQDDLGKQDFTAMAGSAQQFADQASAADGHTNDPFYRLAEGVPFVGSNLTAVRQMSGSLDQLGSEVVLPVANFAKGLNIGVLKPVDGKLNVSLLAEGDTILSTASTALASTGTEVSAIDTTSVLGPVSSAKTQLTDAIGKAKEQVDKARGSLATVQGLLGVDGPRHYILAFLNNAETTGLGGGPASLSMLTVDNGSLAITDQASSTDFPIDDGPVTTVDQNLQNIFGTGIYNTLNWSTSRPDFPTAGKLITAWWQKYRGGQVDGVISIDPITLQYLLAATGPMTLNSNGVQEQITSQNAVQLLLHDIYLRYPNDEIEAKTTLFFADAAKTIFTGLTTTTADPTALLDAITKSIDSGNVMAWSPVKAEQDLWAATPLAGVLPTTNAAKTVVGTYFRDVSTSKTDWWLKTATDLATDVCQNPQNPTFTQTVALESTITPQEADTLPNFVVGVNFKGTKFSTEVYVYGPVGSTLTSAKVGDTSIDAQVRSGASDLGRPVARFLVDLAPGEKNTVTATFSGGTGSFGAPEVNSTPMINQTTTALEAAGCK